MSGSTVSTAIKTGITLGVGNHQGSLSITSTGKVSPGADSENGIYIPSTVSGKIIKGATAASGSVGYGDIAIRNAATLQLGNFDLIRARPASPGRGSFDTFMHAGSLYNTGTIVSPIYVSRQATVAGVAVYLYQSASRRITT